MKSLLLIEDNKQQRKALEEFLNTTKNFLTELDVYLAPDGETARAILKQKEIDIVLSDLFLPDSTGIELAQELRGSGSQIPFLILTGEPSVESAVEALRKGANDYLQKPVELTQLKNKINSFLENINLKKENKNLRQRLKKDFQNNSVIGNSQVIQKILTKVEQISSVDVTVLLEGESGTGKEMIANLIHESSHRADKFFVKINCGALNKNLLESELFGAVKGAYTGAEKDRKGYFEAAHGASIFLDEIGEMDLESQVRLLRVLEEREVTRVGSTKARPVNVRVIAASNKNLLEEVEKGNFREDLYYRLSVVKLKLPSLRERVEDIPILFNHFIVKLNDKYNKSVVSMDKELLNFCKSYPWPGNIREFHNVVEGMLVLAREDILTMEDLPNELREYPKNSKFKLNLMYNFVPGLSLKKYEEEIIKTNLRFFNYNREKTANTLGITERTLYRKINEYDLSSKKSK